MRCFSLLGALFLSMTGVTPLVHGQVAQTSNFKPIAQAFLNFHDTVSYYPVDITDKTGKPILSWRVAILPYIEQSELYRQFKLDEPWDSKNNLKLANQVIKVYQAPNQKEATDAQGRSLTHCMVFRGKGSAFPPGKKSRYQQITDGQSNTILCVEAKTPCIWTKPEDLPFDAEKDFPPLDSVVGLTPAGFHALFFDGSVRWIKSDLDRNTMKLLIMPADGEKVSIP